MASDNDDEDSANLSLSHLVLLDHEDEDGFDVPESTNKQQRWSAVDVISEEKLSSPGSSSSASYRNKKPLWWKRVSQRRATPSQRRAMEEVKEFRLNKPRYGEYVDWDQVFTFNGGKESSIATTGKAVTGTTDGNMDVWLEIGFGNGDNLLCLSRMYDGESDRSKCRRICLVGAEMNPTGLGSIFQKMQRALQQQSHWSEYVIYSHSSHQHNLGRLMDEDAMIDKTIEQVGETMENVGKGDAEAVGIKASSPGVISSTSSLLSRSDLYSNLRIFAGDGIKLIAHVPDRSLSAILVTFPDPFDKAHQSEWRLIQAETVLSFHRVLQRQSCSPGSGPERDEQRNGRLYVATDHEEHARYCIDVVDHASCVQQHRDGNNGGDAANLFRRLEPCPDRSEWLPVVSKYEAQGWAEGRRTHLLCWEAI